MKTIKKMALVLALVFMFSFGGCEDTDTANEIENIIDLTQSGDFYTGDLVEKFYSDDTYSYSFASVKSEYIIVNFMDGTEQNIRDALAEGKIKITDLDRFGIKYYKEPLK